MSEYSSSQRSTVYENQSFCFAGNIIDSLISVKYIYMDPKYTVYRLQLYFEFN